MLGLGDFYITAAVIGSVAASAFGICYGAIHWNKGQDDK